MAFDPSTILHAAIQEIGCKGALAAVSVNGVVRTFSAGSIGANDHGLPFYIYSISKSFTAAAVLKLCEVHGDFLDDSFHRFFPDASIPGDVTVRHLLNHTGGLSDYFSSGEYPGLKGAPFTLSLVLNKTLPQTPFALADEIVRSYQDGADL